MATHRWGLDWEGPFYSQYGLEKLPGIYLIQCDSGRGAPKILDVGEAEDVRKRIETHDREDCWEEECQDGAITYAAHYMKGSTEEQRREIEQDLRKQLDPPCGER